MAPATRLEAPPIAVRKVATVEERPVVAVVHDYLTQRGGAERVVTAMVRTFPGAPIYTSVYEPEGSFPVFRHADVRTSRLNTIGPLRRRHRLLFPVLPAVFGRMHVDAPVALVSSSGWAHGVHAKGRKVVYCHAPARWLYQSDRYLRNRGVSSRVVVGVMGAALRRWDHAAAHSAHRYLANSTAVRDAVRRVYGIDAEVLAAPHAIDTSLERRAVAGLEPGYLLAVSRLMPYKNLDAVIVAMRDLPHLRLVIVGEGPERARLRRAAPMNVRFLGAVSEAELHWLYAHSVGLVAASHEDFGLTVVEAAAFGKPVAALRFGGYLDTVVEDETGVLFDTPHPRQLVRAVWRLASETWDAERITAWAATFAEARFAQRLREIVMEEALAG